MDWDSEADRRMVARLVALLHSFAALAGLAACLPGFLRWPVLAILGRGEAVARVFVMETAFGGTPRSYGAASLAASDAGRLATSFRSLALVLRIMLTGAPEPMRFYADPAGRQRREPGGPRGRVRHADLAGLAHALLARLLLVAQLALARRLAAMATSTTP